MRSILLIFLITVLHCKVSASADTIRIYFKKGVAEADEASTRIIDSLIYHEVISPGKKIAVIGYADHAGKESKNKSLAEERAINVASYLRDMGLTHEDVQCAWGMGEVAAQSSAREGDPENRRVDIIPGGIDIVAFRLAMAAQAAPKPPMAANNAPAPPTEPGVKKSKPAQKKAQKIDLNKVKVNETIRLNDINFAGGTADFLEESYVPLENLVRIMTNNPSLRIRIEGHVCCILQQQRYNDEHRMSAGDELSAQRAKAVYDYLSDKGIDTGRMEYTGFGFNQPLVYPETGAADRIKNRRVEIRVLAK